MKRKWLACSLVFVALALLVGGVFIRGWRPIITAQQPFNESRDQLYVMAHFETPELLYAAQTFSLTNRTGSDLSQIVLRVPGNGNEALALGGRMTQITQVQVNQQDVSFSLDEDDPTILRAQVIWPAGETIDLLVFSHNTVELSGFAAGITLPLLSLYEDGAWREDEWDALAQAPCGPALDGILRLEYPADMKIAFGGALVDAGRHGDYNTMLWQIDGARDVTLAVSKSAAVRHRSIGGAAVTAMADGALRAQQLLGDARKAMESLAAIGLEYPFPSLTIVEAENVREDGHAFSGMIVLEKEKDGEARLRAMTRLVARQTFGVLVGNDAWNEPWLSYTLASTAELLAFRKRAGEAAFEARFFDEIEVSTRLTRPFGVTVGAETARFGGESEMTQVLRDQGAAMMLGVGEAIGYDALANALSRYAADNAYEIAGRQALEAALETVSESSWSGYIEDELYY